MTGLDGCFKFKVAPHRQWLALVEQVALEDGAAREQPPLAALQHALLVLQQLVVPLQAVAEQKRTEEKSYIHIHKSQRQPPLAALQFPYV